MSNIPSDEDFARAKRFMREESRDLDKVCEAVMQRFKRLCPLHDIYILPQRDVNFRAYVFFERESDVEECKRAGIAQDIEKCVFDELELAGRGIRANTTVAFEFDSHENVVANYEGDYLLRLR